MEQDKVRAEFEAWWIDSKHDGEPFFIKHAMWVAWQASRAALVVELPDWEFPHCSEVREAIEAAGIRTK